MILLLLLIQIKSLLTSAGAQSHWGGYIFIHPEFFLCKILTLRVERAGFRRHASAWSYVLGICSLKNNLFRTSAGPRPVPDVAETAANGLAQALSGV